MNNSLLYKTRIPKYYLPYLVILLIIASIFFYYDVPLLTSYFYLTIFSVFMYMMYVARNQGVCVLYVYEDKIKITRPFRFVPKFEFMYQDMYGDFNFEIYKMDNFFFFKKYLVHCMFICGKDAENLNLYLTPNIKDFINATAIIKHKTLLYKKTMKDILIEGGENTGAYLINELRYKGLTDNEIIKHYKNENLSKEEAEEHILKLEEIYEKEIDTIVKDKSWQGYVLLGISLMLLFAGIVLGITGRLSFWILMAFFLGLSLITSSRKLKNQKK